MPGEAPRSDPSARVVTFVTRKGCHLCEEAWAEVERARREVAFRLERLDLADRPDLEPLYGEKIPVVLIDGALAFKFRVTAKELLRKLSARTLPGETGGA